MIERPKYRYVGSPGEHFEQVMEMLEEETKRIATLTKEEKKQYLIDAGVYHLLVRPKKRIPWRKKSTRRKAKDVAKLMRLKRHK
ncbi:hypothetical protein [Chitinophaga varians]|uniref:hypothetical protein n=1 Tax=Chitinophaga varians TaxID=2202339 RepID=UPI00165EC1BC|nr:hypothetical protein [Chitinophaga varians]MBC9911790.1 hypothetical protein [Chitinophaga varians]